MGTGELPQPGTRQGKAPFSQAIVRRRVPSAHLTVDPVVAGSSPVALAWKCKRDKELGYDEFRANVSGNSSGNWGRWRGWSPALLGW
jgi:hypothetical protein